MATQAQTGNRLGNREVAEAMRHASAKLSQDLARTAQDAQEAAAELANAVRNSASDFGEETVTRARATTRAVQRGMREHPIAWGAAAIGVGALIGLLMASRR